MSHEHQVYIERKASPIVDELVTACVLEKPDALVPFMVRWLARNHASAQEYLDTVSVGKAERLRQEVATMQKELAEMQAKLHGGASSDEKSAGAGQGTPISAASGGGSAVVGVSPSSASEAVRQEPVPMKVAESSRSPEVSEDIEEEFEEDSFARYSSEEQ
mmetsp:Transcript_109181/g.315459  ORF Transcript_109181/g.315459 Transcript_109181/m.315459 type:complete len:161 (+) Transcript_109181:116-598(+)